MSSPLDGRIRKLAREEVAAVAGHAADGAPGLDGLQQQITELHEHLHHAATTISRLEARVDVLEKAAGQTDQAQQRSVGRRTARKDVGE